MALVALAWTGLVSAQTTRPAEGAPSAAPAPATWSTTVERFAKAAEKGDARAVLAAMAGDATVRTFENAEQRTPVHSMTNAAAEWRLLGAQGYEFPPHALAGDIAAAVNGSDVVPDKDKERITPFDESELARANATAVNWVAQTLGAERNDLVGVAVFWNVKANRPMFVLVKGQNVDGSFSVTQAVYGDPMARKAVSASAR